MTPGKFKSNQTKTSRQEGGTMLITDKVELKAKSMTQQEEVHHIMIQNVGNRNYIIVINMYVANNIATKYKVNKILERKGELPLQIQFKLKIFFNTHYSELDRSSRPKRSKDLELCSPLQKPLEMRQVELILYHNSYLNFYILRVRYKCQTLYKKIKCKLSH